MSSPKPDDFRMERQEERLVLTFAPTGAEFSIDLLTSGKMDLRQTSGPRDGTNDYDPAEVERMASELGSLAMKSRQET